MVRADKSGHEGAFCTFQARNLALWARWIWRCRWGRRGARFIWRWGTETAVNGMFLQSIPDPCIESLGFYQWASSPACRHGLGSSYLAFGPVLSWNQDRLRITRRTLCLVVGQLWRKLVYPFQQYPWALEPLVDPEVTLSEKQDCVRSLLSCKELSAWCFCSPTLWHCSTACNARTRHAQILGSCAAACGSNQHIHWAGVFQAFWVGRCEGAQPQTEQNCCQTYIRPLPAKHPAVAEACFETTDSNKMQYQQASLGPFKNKRQMRKWLACVQPRVSVAKFSGNFAGTAKSCLKGLARLHPWREKEIFAAWRRLGM